jgi:hypothetical protein
MVRSLHFVQYTPLYPKPLPPRLNPALGAITRLRSVLRFDCETRCSCRPRKVPTVSNQSTENISNFKIELKTNLTLLFQNHVFMIKSDKKSIKYKIFATRNHFLDRQTNYNRSESNKSHFCDLQFKNDARVANLFFIICEVRLRFAVFAHYL